MKVIINLTQFTENEEDLVERFELCKYLGYTLLKCTCGKHIVAKRPHYHTMMLCEFEPNQVYEINTLFGKQKIMKKKIYKTLNKTINDIVRKLGYIADLRVTFKYENGIGKPGISYDETALQYPFKEYESFAKVPTHLQYGYDHEQLTSMWKLAKTEWERKLAKDRIKEEKEQAKKDVKLQYKEYILSKIGKEPSCAHNLFKHESYDFKIRTVIRHSLIFYKMNDIRFRTSTLKDEAINFLFHHGFITEDSIIDKLYI